MTGKHVEYHPLESSRLLWRSWITFLFFTEKQFAIDGIHFKFDKTIVKARGNIYAHF
ncbi:hypothetical protein PM8797T_12983 [Gimesia maris DSM 8797]|nr:hypothetical protein PM8797T_12983 [Gimesia maris DSM 8797]QDT81763.1 hypothetical protein Mal35_52480 [Gimesia maris]